MAETLTIQFGQCGTQIGAKFWEIISAEHCIDSNGDFYGQNPYLIDSINSYFVDSEDGKYIPRSVFIDTDGSIKERIINSSYGKLYKDDQFVVGTQGTGNNYAQGHRTKTAEDLKQNAMDQIRQQIEESDTIQQFNIISSLGGGTGSGLMSLVFECLASDYEKKSKTTFTLIPSLQNVETVIETYNSILGLHNLRKFSNQTICFDNGSLYKICNKECPQSRTDFTQTNDLVGQTLSEITASSRYINEFNTDLRKMYTQLVPYPKLHFMMCGIAPLKLCQHPCDSTTASIKYDYNIFDRTKLLFDCDPFSGRYLAVHGIFRGDIPPNTVNEIIFKTEKMYSRYFTTKFPDHISTSICRIPPKSVNLSSTFLGNTTAIANKLEQLCEQFEKMLEVKAYLHFFLGTGMEEEEFHEALDSVRDVIDSYADIEAENTYIRSTLK